VLSNLRYIFFGALLTTAMFLAFHAGNQAVRGKNVPAQKLFKSFHQLKPSVRPEMTTEMTNEIAVPEKKKIQKPKIEKTKEINKKDLELRTQGNFKHYVSYEAKDKEPNNNVIVAQDDFPVDAKTPLAEKAKAPEGTSRLIAGDQFQRVTVISRDNGTPQGVVPRFTEVYVPIYTAANVNGLDTNGRSLVIERAIASAGDASSYQILVYNADGTQFLGAIQSAMSPKFPFQGLPALQRVEGNSFEATTRFIIFTEEPSQDILQDQAHMESILESAYRATLDSQTFIGTDPNFGLDIYTLFPGIYLGRDKQ